MDSTTDQGNELLGAVAVPINRKYNQFVSDFKYQIEMTTASIRLFLRSVVLLFLTQRRREAEAQRGFFNH